MARVTLVFWNVIALRCIWDVYEYLKVISPIWAWQLILHLYFFISFTLYPAYSRIAIENLVVRHIVPHILSDFRDIACWAAELKVAFCLHTRALPLRHDWPQNNTYFIMINKQLHAVSRTHQGRQRETSVKTLRSPLSLAFWRHWVLSGRTQRRA